MIIAYILSCYIVVFLFFIYRIIVLTPGLFLQKKQIVLPTNIPKRLGLTACSRLKIVEEQDSLRIVPSHPIKPATVKFCAGMVTAPKTGKLHRFDRV